MKFYICKHCGNVAVKVTDHNTPLSCCGDVMKELLPNTIEAALEKHKPVIVNEEGGRFAVVGSVTHPMTPEHYIEWIVVEYPNHYRTYHLNPNDEPKVKICGNCDPINMYAYCNIHGLWEMDK